jgi:hypothetical protein
MQKLQCGAPNPEIKKSEPGEGKGDVKICTKAVSTSFDISDFLIPGVVGIMRSRDTPSPQMHHIKACKNSSKTKTINNESN